MNDESVNFGRSVLLSCGIDPDSLPELDRGPVYNRLKADAEKSLQALVDHLVEARTLFTAYAEADAGHEIMMTQAHGLFDAATMALVRFRDARWMKGSA